MKVHLTTQDKINEAITQLANIEPNGAYEVEIKRLPQTRTARQNRAIHLYCELIANQCVEQGVTIHQVLKEAVERQWTKEAVKELIWRQIQVALTGKKSTTELHREEVSKVAQIIGRNLAMKHGIDVPFPTIER